MLEPARPGESSLRLGLTETVENWGEMLQRSLVLAGKYFGVAPISHGVCNLAQGKISGLRLPLKK